MKPGKPLKRKTPLASRTQLARSTPAMRATRLTRTAIVAKRPKVTPEERAARKGLRQRSGGVCECGCRRPAHDAHHRRNRSQSGTWALSNLMHLNHDCHMRITTNPKMAMGQGWTVRSGRNPADVPVWVGGHGFCFLLDDGSIEEVDENEVA